MGWDVGDWPGDDEWAWLDRIYDFMPLFRSCVNSTATSAFFFTLTTRITTTFA